MKLNRVFIFEGTGSAKTTLAKKISVMLKTPFYTTDNFVYRENFLKNRLLHPERWSLIGDLSDVQDALR